MKSISTTHTVNVGSTERLVSIVAGSLLLFDGIANNKFRVAKLLAGGLLMFRGATGNCPLYRLAGRSSAPPSKNINIRLKMFVDKPRGEVYAAWRKLENLPLFMDHLESVTEVFDNISEWKAKLPGRIPVKWRACIIQDIPGEEITWRSLPDSSIENAGKVEFRDGETAYGTDIHVNITYRPPLGLLGEAAGEFFSGSLEKMVREDVYGFKKFIEDRV
jgi:uncharacterized membrane protein